METREKSIDVTETSKDEVLNPIETPAAPQAAEESTEAVPAETPVCDDQCPENAEPSAPAPKSKEEVLEALTRLAADEAAEISREEIARLKQLFYAFRKAELEQEMADFVAQGNEEAAFVPAVNESEEKFKELMNTVKDRKAAIAAAQEAEKQQNFERKKALIDELAAISADTDNVNRAFPRVKEIQAEFKLIGEVPATEATDQWKAYQQAVEQFYDQLKVNKDLRDYDFKKNLELKTMLCEEAEKLNAEEDIILAFKRLQNLHDEWRQAGPVAKEIRDEIWARFKDASAVINKKYQAFFEERKAREAENEAAKTAICERVEALDFSQLNSFNAWEEMTKTILAAQEDWKKLGFASRKVNNALFARFRSLCDKFFAAKGEYYRKVKDELSANLAKKIALCEKAEALKDSTDWRKTADTLVALQKEWKTIGSVPKKHSDTVWHRFQQACDSFFENRKKNQSESRSEEQTNLPFREKDKIYDEYRAVCDTFYARSRDSRGSMSRFEDVINEMGSDENKLYRERERIMRAFEIKRNELKTYENNLGFLTSKSKSGDSMVKEMERRIQRIKDDLASIEEKIKLIDAKL